MTLVQEGKDRLERSAMANNVTVLSADKARAVRDTLHALLCHGDFSAPDAKRAWRRGQKLLNALDAELPASRAALAEGLKARASALGRSPFVSGEARHEVEKALRELADHVERGEFDA